MKKYIYKYISVANNYIIPKRKTSRLQTQLHRTEEGMEDLSLLQHKASKGK